MSNLPPNDGSDEIKDFYRTFHDRITDKRIASEFPVRRAVHDDIYQSVLKNIEMDERVLDAGAGEGNLAILMSDAGARVTAVDYSLPNIKAAAAAVREHSGPNGTVLLCNGDAENLPFPNDSFDCVVSNHVLEHLPDFEKGVAEIYRVTRGKALIAVPTCLSPAAWPLLGGGNYWQFSVGGLPRMIFGLVRVVFALVTGREGVNEGYGGRAHIIHIFRFPWRVKKILQRSGFKIHAQEAQSTRLPWLNRNPILKTGSRIGKYLGIGTVWVVSKPQTQIKTGPLNEPKSSSHQF